MVNLYPLTFKPIFKERLWGGRNLESLYSKPLPPGPPIGESWEVSDRPGDESAVASGPLKGRTLHWLMENCPAALLGSRGPIPARFPLLIKIIDAQATLSLQVHPPPSVAASLGGEPKTEMWYVAQAQPGAELFVGLKNGVTRAEFESKLASQKVAECFHVIRVKAGDSMFLPSGRVHALGAGTMIFEIQQNSDTTYRVFDWNRLERDGKPRALHIPQSLASINFSDFEPSLLPRDTTPAQPGTVRPLVNDPLFNVDLRQWAAGDTNTWPAGKMRILGVVEGALMIEGSGEQVEIPAGGFCLIPAQCDATKAQALRETKFLEIL